MTEKQSGQRLSVWRILRFFLIVYAGLVILMGCFQRSYIYYPATDDFSRLEAEAEREGYVPWRLADGDPAGWRPAERGDGPRMVVFHGNAGHALYRTYYAQFFSWAFEGEDWEVLLFEYPGYGAREGRPSEKIFVEAALEAVDALREEEPDRPLYLLGESLGSGVAGWMAEERPGEIDGLLMVTPFTSLAAVGSAHFPFLPVRLLLRDRYHTAEHLRAYSGPMAVLLAAEDRVVPAKLGRELYEGFDGPKRLWEIEGADHNTLFDRTGSELWEQILGFLRNGEDGEGMD